VHERGWVFGVIWLCLAVLRPVPGLADDFVTSGPYGILSGENLPSGGAATVVFRHLFDRAGLQGNVVFAPRWLDAENGARQGRYTGAFPYYYTLNRSLDFAYSDAVLTVGERLYTLDSRAPLRRVEDLNGLALCYPLGYDLPSELQLLLDAGRFDRVTPDDMARCFRLVVTGQVDVVLTDQSEAAFQYARGAVDMARVVENPLPVSQRTLHLMVAHDQPHADRIIAAFNDALAAARSDGSLRRLLSGAGVGTDLIPERTDSFRDQGAVDGILQLTNGATHGGRISEITPGRYQVMDPTEFGQGRTFPRNAVARICPPVGCGESWEDEVTAADGKLRLHGSNPIGERLAPALVEGFVDDRGATLDPWITTAGNERTAIVASGTPGNFTAVEIHAHGSSAGFRSLLAGTADIAMSSRRIKPSERRAMIDAGLGRISSRNGENVIALDGVAVIVHPDNPIRTLTIDQIRAAFIGSARRWRDLDPNAPDRPIAVYARDDKSGTYDTFRSLVLGAAPLNGGARRFASSASLAAAVAAAPDAIGFIGLSHIGDARAVRIRTCEAVHQAASFGVKTEEYPLARRLYFYNSPNQASRDVGALLAFVTGPGQAEVADAGYVDLGIGRRDREEHLDFMLQAATVAHQSIDVAQKYLRRIRSMQRLSVTFRFETDSSALDERAMDDVVRLAAYLERAENRGTDVVMVGFADNRGGYAYNLRLALDRARAVAAALRRESPGLGSIDTLSVGEDLAVACNEPGTFNLNRRVEVWVGPVGRGGAR